MRTTESAAAVRTNSRARSRPGFRLARAGLWALRRYLPPTAAFLVLLLAWELATRIGWLPRYIFPAPSAIAATMWVKRSLFWYHTALTLLEIGVGLGLGVVTGVLVGVAIALISVLRSALYPLVVASQSFPPLALAPILVLWLGYGIAPKVVLVVQVIFFPVAVATIAGLTSVKPEVLVFGRSLGASPWSLFFKVQVPASLPYFFSGLKVSAAYGAIAAIIGEWMGANRGLGALMLRANNQLYTDIVFGTIVISALLGLGLFGLAALAERLVIPWHRRGTVDREAA